MQKFTPESSLVKSPITIQDIIRKDPTRKTLEGNLFSTEVPIENWAVKVEPRAVTNFDGYAAADLPETPKSIACLYFFGRAPNGDCKPTDTQLPNPTGGSHKVVAVVIAYDHPDAATELINFSEAFALPAASFPNPILASGNVPARDSSADHGWDLEASFDLEWVHAMAPDADLLLVEADDDTFSALSVAINRAGSEVQAAGGGVVSVSWSWPVGSITPDLLQKFEAILTKWDKVTFVVAAGDNGEVVYPASSPNVVAVGGTVVNRDLQGVFQHESAWSKSGAGLGSPPRPSYQNNVSKIFSNMRGVADISAVADNLRGGLSFFSRTRGWIGFSGTSASAPIVAGLIVNARSQPNRSFLGSQEQLDRIYANFGMPNSNHFSDVFTGSCGATSSRFDADKGWDFCTGVGTPKGISGFN